MDLYRLKASVPNDFQPLQLGRVFDECESQAPPFPLPPRFLVD